MGANSWWGHWRLYTFRSLRIRSRLPDILLGPGSGVEILWMGFTKKWRGLWLVYLFFHISKITFRSLLKKKKSSFKRLAAAAFSYKQTPAKGAVYNGLWNEQPSFNTTSHCLKTTTANKLHIPAEVKMQFCTTCYRAMKRHALSCISLCWWNLSLPNQY